MSLVKTTKCQARGEICQILFGTELVVFISCSKNSIGVYH